MPTEPEELNLLVIVPKGGECREYEITVSPKESGDKLKKHIEKASGVPCEDMELFFKNPDKEAKQKWIFEDATLQQQEIADNAVITVGVHGMRGCNTVQEAADGDGEAPQDAVQNSIYTKGDSSYYHAHARKAEIPEEHRIVSGGSPKKLGESEAPLPEPVSALKRLARDEEGQDPGRPERPIVNYSWGDEKETIKIYITHDSEPAAVAAAGDGSSGQVEVRWQPKALKLKVHAEKLDYVLELERIYYEIVPEECKFRVSTGKRITLTLKKKEAYSWLKLLKPE